MKIYNYQNGIDPNKYKDLNFKITTKQLNKLLFRQKKEEKTNLEI